MWESSLREGCRFLQATKPLGSILMWRILLTVRSTACKLHGMPWYRSKLGTGLTDDAARVIGSSLTSLRRLSISRCAELGVRSFCHGSAHEPFVHQMRPDCRRNPQEVTGGVQTPTGRRHGVQRAAGAADAAAVRDRTAGRRQPGASNLRADQVCCRQPQGTAAQASPSLSPPLCSCT